MVTKVSDRGRTIGRGLLWHLVLTVLAATAVVFGVVVAAASLTVGDPWIFNGYSANRAIAWGEIGRTAVPAAALIAAAAAAVIAVHGHRTRLDELQATRDANVTDRYTKAVEQLAHDNPSVRLGGIYALQRIANDSLAVDGITVGLVLAAHIRRIVETYLASEPGADPVDQSQHDTWSSDVIHGATVLTVLADRLREAGIPHASMKLIVTDFGGLRAPRLQAPRIQLTRTLLVDADLRGANLRGADLHEASLRDADLTGADLEYADLEYADLEAADLTRTNLERATLTRSNLQFATLEGASLGNADLDHADLTHANLKGAILAGAHLADANLTNTDLSKASLRRARLTRARLENAFLEGADLERADLRGADLRSANLEGANLEGTNLEGAQMPKAWKG